MFVSRINPTTGKMEWVVTNKDYESMDTDLSEEFSRSQYGDMLHDTERNQKYYQGLRWAIDHLKSKGVEPRVLDIGTGTGLLSMMAAQCGAKSVTACEALKPMVKIARQSIEDNGFQNIIKVIPKHSKTITVGQSDCDLPIHANILVTEIFDSELIGEGAIPTFSHAAHELLESEALVIPFEAHVYAQLIQSKFLWRSQSLDPSQLPTGVQVNIPGSWKQCPGPASLWDLHLEEVQVPDQLVHLSEPHLVAKFNFSDPSLPKNYKFKPVTISPTTSGLCHGIAIWWTITMAPGVVLSMSPWQPNGQWRDHWLACVQLISEPFSIQKAVPIEIQAINDEYTLWTVLQQGNTTLSSNRPVCTCGVHLAWSRSRLRMMNDNERNTKLMEALTKILPSKSTVLCVSDGSLLPIMCAQQNVTALKKIFTVESNPHSAKSLKELFCSSCLKDTIKLLTTTPTDLTLNELDNCHIDVLLAEPFFISTTLPWHNLFFWYIRSKLIHVLSPNAIIMPCKAYLKAIAVTFDNLHYLKAPVGTVEGLDISAYDKAVAKCHHDSPPKALPPEDYSLWEYPCYPLSGVQTLMKFDFTCPVPLQTVLETKGSWSLTSSGPCHGIVLWMDYQLTTDNDLDLLSEGLLQQPKERTKLVWSTCHNQAVCFFMDYQRCNIYYEVKLDTTSGNMEFDFR